MIIDIGKQGEDENFNLEELQRETIESMGEYIQVLCPKMKDMVCELRGELKDDTWEFLRMMIDGFNWVLEAYNGTSSIVNKDDVIDEDMVQESVDRLGKCFVDKKNIDVADVLEKEIIPFLETLGCACNK